jgi:hypothetical protein
VDELKRTSSMKWMNWRGRHKRLKGSLRNTRNGNKGSTTIFVSYARASALLVILSLQLLWLDAVNICGLMCGLMPVWCVDSYAGLMWWYFVSGSLLMCEMLIVVIWLLG